MSREKNVQDTAYSIWEAEGRPHGRDADHWRMAEERVAQGDGRQSEPAAAAAPKGSKKQDQPGKSAPPAPASGSAKSSAGKSRAKKTV